MGAHIGQKARAPAGQSIIWRLVSPGRPNGCTLPLLSLQPPQWNERLTTARIPCCCSASGAIFWSSKLQWAPGERQIFRARDRELLLCTTLLTSFPFVLSQMPPSPRMLPSLALNA